MRPASLTICANCHLLRPSAWGPACSGPIRLRSRPLPAGRRFSAMAGNARRQGDSFGDSRNLKGWPRDVGSSQVARRTDHRQAPAGGIYRAGKQAARRNGASAPSMRSSASIWRPFAACPMRGRRASAPCSAGLQRFGWEPVEEDGNVIALTGGACNITLGARRTVRALRRPGRDDPPDLRRGADPSEAGEGGRQRARHRHAGHGLRSQIDARGSALDAQGPLQDHARSDDAPAASSAST